jgi:curved DNA-binding protein CbpA
MGDMERGRGGYELLNYYRILGLEPDADLSEIRRAFRVLAKRHHPDEGGDEELFKQIGIAFCVLSDPQSRKEYDMLMHFREETRKGAPHGAEIPEAEVPYSGTMESAWNLWNEVFAEEEQQARDARERGRRTGRKRRTDTEDLWEDGYGAYAEDGEDDLMESYSRFSRSVRSGRRTLQAGSCR